MEKERNIHVPIAPTIVNFLKPEENITLERYLKNTQVSRSEIRYGDTFLKINVKKDMEESVQSLMAQMITRGIYDYETFAVKAETKRALFQTGYYKADGDQIQANDGMIFNTTIIRSEKLNTLFDLKTGLSASAYENEEKKVVNMLASFANKIVNQEIKKLPH